MKPRVEEPPQLADGSAVDLPAQSSAVIAALIAHQSEPAMCAHVASSLISGSCDASRGALAAAIDDVETAAVVGVLRGRAC